MSARMNPSRQLALGVLIVSTLSLLAYYTLFLTESSLFGNKEQISITFAEARGLRVGDSVLVAGVRWGRVAEVEYDSSAAIDDRITVVATLSQPVEFREGGSFQIKDSTLLGGRVLSIDPGPPGSPSLPPDSIFHGDVVTSPLDAMGELLGDKNLSTTLEDFSVIVKNAREGKGVIGQLLTSDELADHLNESMGNIHAITESVREGKGTVGKLLMAEELYASIKHSADHLEATLADVEAGKGTIGALLKDEELADEVRVLVTNFSESAVSIQEITQGLKEGKGTLGKLLKDDTIFKNVSKASEDIAAITEALTTGDGTLTKLIFDHDLYDQLEVALNTITRALEEYREAAPVTTMTSVLFNAF